MNYLYITQLLVILFSSTISLAESLYLNEITFAKTKIVTGEEFYRSEYEKVYNSEEMKKFMIDAVNNHGDINMTDNQKLIFVPLPQNLWVRNCG